MPSQNPNILFIMSDDHASHALSCYGSRINSTPNLDRIANEGARFDNCFCTNSICTPSRAAILTGTYNHINGVTTLSTHMDNTLPTFVKDLRASGYQNRHVRQMAPRAGSSTSTGPASMIGRYCPGKVCITIRPSSSNRKMPAKPASAAPSKATSPISSPI